MTLGTPLFNTGILQFGRFTDDKGTAQPYRLRLEMLAAYPSLLQQVAYRGVQQLAHLPSFDRFVTLSDSIPIATAISLNTGISLIYSRGTTQPLVHDLVGAYDVGHPTCLIVNSVDDTMKTFINASRKVGLEIHSVLEVVHQGHTLSGITQTPIMTMPAILHELRQYELITEHMVHAVNRTRTNLS